MKNTDTPSIERLRELLAELAGAEASYRGVHDRRGDGDMLTGRAWDRLRRAGDKARATLETLTPTRCTCFARSADECACGAWDLNNAATLAAGEGVEREELIRRVEAGLNLASLLTGDVPCTKLALDTLSFAFDALKALSLPTTEIRRGAFTKAIKALHKCVCFSAFSVEQPLSIRFDFTSEDDRLAAANALDDAFEALETLTPSPPLEQPDIEGRARELLARFHESGGNKAAAFTVRKVGPTGIVLEAQHAVLVYALSLPTTEIRRGALEEAAREIDDAYGAADQEPCRCNVDELSCPHCNAWDRARKRTREILAALACPPSRPSFDKWDFAGAVLKDNEGCGR